jgi:hypothetical protein
MADAIAVAMGDRAIHLRLERIEQETIHRRRLGYRKAIPHGNSLSSLRAWMNLICSVRFRSSCRRSLIGEQIPAKRDGLLAHPVKRRRALCGDTQTAEFHTFEQ